MQRLHARQEPSCAKHNRLELKRCSQMTRSTLEAVDGGVGREGSDQLRRVRDGDDSHKRSQNGSATRGAAIQLHEAPNACAFEFLSSRHRYDRIDGSLDGSENDGLRWLSALNGGGHGEHWTSADGERLGRRERRKNEQSSVYARCQRPVTRAPR